MASLYCCVLTLLVAVMPAFALKQLPLTFMSTADDAHDVSGLIVSVGNEINPAFEPSSSTIPPQPPRVPGGASVLTVLQLPGDDEGWEVFLVRNGTLVRTTTKDLLHYTEPAVVLTVGSTPFGVAGIQSLDRNRRSGEYLLATFSADCPAWHGRNHSCYGQFYTSHDGVHWGNRLPKGTPAMRDHDDAGIFAARDTAGFMDFQVTLEPVPGGKPWPDNVGCCLKRVLTVRTSGDGYHWDGNTGDGTLRSADTLDPPELEFYQPVKTFAEHYM